jgi:type II secretory pathway predicted ATPase ExeA
MYLHHWQLERKPFEPSVEGGFLYETQAHQEATCKLQYALENPRAAALLTGPSGVGKTLLVDMLAAHASDAIAPLVRVVYPQMPPRELLCYLAARIEGSQPSTPLTWPVDHSWAVLESTLGRLHDANQRPLVVFDEAHLLEDSGCLETVRLLLNLHREGTPLVTLLLVGNSSLVASLSRHPRLEERIDITATLEALTDDETAAYVNHRLLAAGATRELFTRDACEALQFHAQGMPRRINRLGDLALVIGFAQRATQVTAALVDSVAHELALGRAA